MAHLILAGLLAILGWSVFVLISPYRLCRWCKDKRGQRPARLLALQGQAGRAPSGCVAGPQDQARHRAGLG